jgi:magnesium transporter
MSTVKRELQTDSSSRMPRQPQILCSIRHSDGRVEFQAPIDALAESLADPQATIWLDIVLHDGETDAVHNLFRDVFHFNELAIEDALSECNVPKLDEWTDYLYIVFHAVRFNPENDDLRFIELDLFLGKNYLVSVHSEPIPAVDRLRRLLHKDPDHQFAQGPDHLLYHLLDMVVSDHVEAIEHLDDTIDLLGDEIIRKPSPVILQRVLHIKQLITKLSRIIGPEREVANRLVRDSFPQVDLKDRMYFRNVYDQLVRLHDITEIVRDLVTSDVETYLSVMSNRTNDVMKTLTLVTVLFLPLNFLVGFFGMNFFGDNIHVSEWELPHQGIFWLAVFAMACSPAALYFYGKHRKWY